MGHFLSATFSRELYECSETNSCPVVLSQTSALKNGGRTHTEALERASRKIIASLLSDWHIVVSQKQGVARIIKRVP